MLRLAICLLCFKQASAARQTGREESVLLLTVLPIGADLCTPSCFGPFLAIRSCCQDTAVHCPQHFLAIYRTHNCPQSRAQGSTSQAQPHCVSRKVTIHFSPGDKSLHCKHKLSLWQAGVGGSLPIHTSDAGCFWPICSKRFTWTHPNSLLYFLSFLAVYLPQNSLPSHVYKYKPPAPNWSQMMLLAKESGQCLSSMKLTLEKITERRGLDNLPMIKERDGNSISNERGVLLHFYSAHF